MAYRSDEDALQLQVEHLERELAVLTERETAVSAELQQERELEARAAARLREAGPGSGPQRSGRRDRIDLAVLVLVLASLPLLFLHAAWHRYILTDATVIPAILLLGTPGLLGAILALPYQRRGARFKLLFLAAGGMAAAPLVNLCLSLV